MKKIEFGLSKEQFNNLYFEKNFFFRKAAVTTDLLSWSEINQSFHSMEVGEPKVKLFKGGKVDEARYTEAYTHVGLPRKRFNREVLYRYIRNGATLVLGRYDQNSLTVKSLCDEVSEFVDAHTIANAYIAFGGDGSFGSHWDTHDVFAIQLRGKKRWQIYEPTFQLPLSHQTSKYHKHERPQDPVFDEILDAGDILYLPRGWWHNALPIGEETVHIAIGIHPPKMIDYLLWACAARMPEFLSARSSIREADQTKNLSALIQDLGSVLLNPNCIEQFLHAKAPKQRSEDAFQIDLHASPTKSELELMRYVKDCFDAQKNTTS